MHEDLLLLDHIRLNFSQAGLHLMNITIGFIMFGVALGIKTENFKKVFLHPKGVIVGLGSQYLLLPALTFLAVWLLDDFITPSVAFGMLLVASCPGGNVSNFISSVAKANVELSVSMTAIGTILAVIFTPLNFSFWGGLYSTTSPLLRPIEIDPLEMFRTVFIILGVPVIAGMIFAQKLPKITQKIIQPIRSISLLVFGLFIVLAFRNNFNYFVEYIYWILFIVLLHHLLALVSGYSFAAVFGLNRINRRTVAIETSIQNSGLALVLLFNPRIFPPEINMGGMAFIAAWWGIWHIVAGLSVAGFWAKYRPLKTLTDA
ncbi:MAG: bile acid:sodium symporter family protein [Bacteroidales bacterium]|jgi:BASS family bile acid:Na+ symporter|nr:bile acid:sodium symporter family protein [Bacteroidales bacterium]